MLRATVPCCVSVYYKVNIFHTAFKIIFVINLVKLGNKPDDLLSGLFCCTRILSKLTKWQYVSIQIFFAEKIKT